MPRKSTHTDARWWTLPWLRFGRLEHHELSWLVVGLGACLLLFAFVSLAGEVTEGDTQAFDTKILQALRDPSDLSKPIGPAWVEDSLLDAELYLWPAQARPLTNERVGNLNF